MPKEVRSGVWKRGQEQLTFVTAPSLWNQMDHSAKRYFSGGQNDWFSMTGCHMFITTNEVIQY